MGDVSPVGMDLGTAGTMMRLSLPYGLAAGAGDRRNLAKSVELETAGGSDAAAEAGARARENERLEQACSEFEAIFIEMILKSARASIPKGGLFSSEEEELVREMLDSQLAQEVAKGGGIGLAKFMERNMTGDGKAVKQGGAGEL